MTVDKQQHRALYLADVLAAGFECDQEWYEIESAKELRRLYAENVDYGATIDHLARENAEQIGEIVALKEQRDELLEALKELMDREWQDDEGDFTLEMARFERFAALVREACAKVCTEIMDDFWTGDDRWEAARHCAESIRARGNL